jgi:hypothetical protein
MISYKDYADSFESQCDPGTLDISRTETGYGIFGPSGLSATPAGHSYQHNSEEFIRLLITDLQLFHVPGLRSMASPVLFGFLKDILETGPDPFPEDWDALLLADPFVRIKREGRPLEQPFGPDDRLFSFSFVSLSRLVGAVNDFAGKIMGEVSLGEDETQPFTSLLWLSYERLPLPVRAAVQALSTIHGAGIVMPLMVVSGAINPVEYAKGLISMKAAGEGDFTAILAEASRVKAFLKSLDDRRGQRQHLAALIREGEGDVVEFKSTLRWDIRQAKTNPAIERACLKTISAFLNSGGGNLLIGVRDDGSIEGIETDKFANEDKFLLHLWTLIRTCLGRDVSPYISTRTAREDGKTVCMVTCMPSARPVFLRQPGFDEEMFIRVGPSSHAMDISEALKYVADRFAVR